MEVYSSPEYACAQNVQISKLAVFPSHTLFFLSFFFDSWHLSEEHKHVINYTVLPLGVTKSHKPLDKFKAKSKQTKNPKRNQRYM